MCLFAFLVFSQHCIISVIFQCTNPETFIESQLQLAAPSWAIEPRIVIGPSPGHGVRGPDVPLRSLLNPCHFAVPSVRSRNLLIYEEHSPLEEPSSAASAGELGRWDRGSSLLRASGLEPRPDVDLPHFIVSNESSLEKSVLLELQQHL